MPGDIANNRHRHSFQIANSPSNLRSSKTPSTAEGLQKSFQSKPSRPNNRNDREAQYDNLCCRFANIREKFLRREGSIIGIIDDLEQIFTWFPLGLPENSPAFPESHS